MGNDLARYWFCTSAILKAHPHGFRSTLAEQKKVILTEFFTKTTSK